MFRNSIFPVALLILAGCVAEGQNAFTSNPSTNVIENSRVDPETGNLIAWWMTRREGTPKGQRVPVLVSHPYAVFIQWPSGPCYPDSQEKRIFIFYDNVTKKSYQTRDFDTFLDVLTAQPHNIRLLQFETCSAPRCCMPEKQWQRLEKVLADGHRTWGIDPVTGSRFIRICYCAFDWHFIFPGENKRKEPGITASSSAVK